jgi:hypothetical protein
MGEKLGVSFVAFSIKLHDLNYESNHWNIKFEI